MKKNLITVLALFTVMMAGCDKAKVDIHEGEGFMKYEGVTYPLNMSTIITGGPSHDIYVHDVSFISDETGSFFSFYMENTNSSVPVPEGTLTISKDGEYTGSFAIILADETKVADGEQEGTLTVSKSGDRYTFSFTGNDGGEDPKALQFEYTGVVARK